MREYEEVEPTYANNVTSDTCSPASIPQRKKSNAIFASENLEKSDKLIDSVNNTAIND